MTLLKLWKLSMTTWPIFMALAVLFAVLGVWIDPRWAITGAILVVPTIATGAISIFNYHEFQNSDSAQIGGA